MRPRFRIAPVAAGLVLVLALAEAGVPQVPARPTKPGGFRYTVAGAGEDASVDSSVLQYQSTSDELVIGLVQGGAVPRYAVSLFLPLTPATTALKAYDARAFKKGPTASIFIGAAFYHALSGRLILEAAPKGTISGTFEFKARHESDAGRTADVKGTFLEIPLTEKKAR